MIMPIDIDKKEFSRDKKGYNSREVDEFLDIIVADYEKVLNDNRSMAHKIKALEKQLEEAQKDDNAMVETLETAKKLMADISASAERRAELMMRDAELEAENMLLDAKVNVRKLNDEYEILSAKVRRLKGNFRKMLQAEIERLDGDDFDIIRDLSDEVEIPEVTEPVEENISKAPTIVIDKIENENPVAADFSVPVADLEHATVSDLSDGLKAIAEDASAIDNTIILK
jgi:cell division initiation protein